MKKYILIVVFISCFLLTSCRTKTSSTKRDSTAKSAIKSKDENNMNTPFVELDNESKKLFENSFSTSGIYVASGYEKYHSLDERESKTINWQENRTQTNRDDYHVWLTCYYMKDDTLVVHVERSDKGIENHEPSYFEKEYLLGNYGFCVYGEYNEWYSYILVYKNGNLYELDYAYKNGIIDDEEVKSVYKSYIESKYLKFDPYYNPYIPIVNPNLGK
ncbi:MAG: hypothetical protein K6E24_03720 [bacterium]|nr:hypothetical protein [bacterium]